MFFPLIAAALAQAVAVPDTRPVPGTITVQTTGDAIEDQPFADAVESALSGIGYTPLPAPSHSRYVAIIMVKRDAHGQVTSSNAGGSPVAGIAGLGAGIGLALPKKNDQLRDLVVTQLSVTIALRSDRHPLWSGSAVTAQVQGTRTGAPGAVAAKLADALIAAIPRVLDAPLSIP